MSKDAVTLQALLDTDSDGMCTHGLQQGRRTDGTTQPEAGPCQPAASDGAGSLGRWAVLLLFSHALHPVHPTNPALVEALLRQGGASPAVVQQRIEAAGLLCMAAAARQPAVVEALLALAAAGPKTRIKASLYEALQVAVRRSCPRTAALLLRAGADPRVNVPSFSTLLHSMALAEDVEAPAAEMTALCKLLVAHGSPVNALDGHGNTPLHFASQYANVAMVRALLECGASVGLRGPHGTTPLHEVGAACVLGCPERRGSALIAAQHAQRVAAVAKALLAAGADVNLKEAKGGSTPLHTAALLGNAAVAAALLAHSAGGYIPDARGLLPVHAASGDRVGYAWRAIEAIEASARADPQQLNVHACTRGRQTPLTMAVRNRRVEVVRALLRLGAKVEPERQPGPFGGGP